MTSNIPETRDFNTFIASTYRIYHVHRKPRTFCKNANPCKIYFRSSTHWGWCKCLLCGKFLENINSLMLMTFVRHREMILHGSHVLLLLWMELNYLLIIINSISAPYTASLFVSEVITNHVLYFNLDFYLPWNWITRFQKTEKE